MTIDLESISKRLLAGKEISESEACQLKELASNGDGGAAELLLLYTVPVRETVYLPPDEWELFKKSLRRSKTVSKLRAEAKRMRKDGYLDVAKRLCLKADELFLDSLRKRTITGKKIWDNEIYQLWKLKDNNTEATDLYRVLAERGLKRGNTWLGNDVDLSPSDREFFDRIVARHPTIEDLKIRRKGFTRAGNKKLAIRVAQEIQRRKRSDVARSNEKEEKS